MKCIFSHLFTAWLPGSKYLKVRPLQILVEFGLPNPCCCNAAIVLRPTLSVLTGAGGRHSALEMEGGGGDKASALWKPGITMCEPLGRGWPIDWHVGFVLWSGSGSPWQRACSHPALSKVSAGTSKRGGGGGGRAHMGLGAPCTGGSVAWGGEAFNTQNRWVEEYRNPEALAATWSISSKRQRAGKVALKWLILKSNPLLQGGDWWSEYEEGIRHLSKEALNQVLLTPACRSWKALVTTHTISALRTVISLHFNLYALVALFCDMYFGSQGTLVYFF